MLSNGTRGVRKDKAANRLDYTLNPSDIDYIDHQKVYQPYPKMIYRGDGVAESMRRTRWGNLSRPFCGATRYGHLRRLGMVARRVLTRQRGRMENGGRVMREIR